MRMVSLNIERSRHLSRVIPFLQRWAPDVVCLQELEEQNLAMLCDQTGLVHSEFAAMARHPDSTGPGKFGVAVLSRQPIEAAETFVYAGGGTGTDLLDRTSEMSRIDTCRFVALQVRLSGQRTPFYIATTHFPWTPDGLPRPFQTAAVARLTSALTACPMVLTGDFNAPRGGPIFEVLADTWRDNIPPDVTTTLDPELHRAGPLDLVVDGLFTTDEIIVRDVRLLAGLSDHQAITARLVSTG
jgi:endonuclease/exonuclease/phosphatase family metal-dependent hydrolase